MENLVDTIDNEKYIINIYQDDNPANPREWDNLGKMVCFHRRYDLGDKHDFYDADDLIEYLKQTLCVQLPLYLYDHSGISMSTSNQYPYNDYWDAGQVGIIFVTYEQLHKEYGWKHITKARREQIESYLEQEVKTYNEYLTGEVFGYQVECNFCHEIIDSCWGFYGRNWKENGLLDHAYTKCDCEGSLQLAFPELSIDYISEEV